MASTYNPELDKSKQQTAASTSTDLSAQTAPTANTQLGSTPGAEGYSARLKELTGNGGTYTPSQAVMDAQKYLQGIIDNKPGSYESKYTTQLQGLYDQIMNREKFSYDVNNDMIYQQAKDQYQQMGRTAMMDTMGQAAAMTGGYGSSYANSVGQQAYQGYMQQLNQMIPELYKAAYDRYAQEGQDLRNTYAMVKDADQTDYGRWQDEYSRWADERSYAQGAYKQAYDQDYADYNTRLSAAMQAIGMEREDAKQTQQTAYSTAMAMIEKGLLPSSDMLAAAGISDADALELAKKYGYREPRTSSGSSSRNKSSGGGSGNNTGGIDYIKGAKNLGSMLATAAAAVKPAASLVGIFKELTKKK